MKNILIILSGPSGVGKTTIANHLFKKLPKLQKAVTFTTRKKRKQAQEDKIMKHISEKKFIQMIQKGEFIEYANVHGNLYGTHKPTLEKLLKKSPVLQNIDIQGGLQIMNKIPEVISIFIKPDSIKVLKQRLVHRHTDPTALQTRLANAKKEIAQGKKYQYTVVNKDGELNKCIGKITDILKKELK